MARKLAFEKHNSYLCKKNVLNCLTVVPNISFISDTETFGGNIYISLFDIYYNNTCHLGHVIASTCAIWHVNSIMRNAASRAQTKFSSTSLDSQDITSTYLFSRTAQMKLMKLNWHSLVLLAVVVNL